MRVAICMSLRSYKPVQSYQRRRIKAPFLAAKTSFLLNLNKFERFKLWQITVCQSNVLIHRSALSDAVSAFFLADLTMYVTLIFERNSISFFQSFALRGRDLFKAFSEALLNILNWRL